MDLYMKSKHRNDSDSRCLDAPRDVPRTHLYSNISSLFIGLFAARRHLSAVMFRRRDSTVREPASHSNIHKNPWKCIKIAVRAKLLLVNNAYNGYAYGNRWQFTFALQTIPSNRRIHIEEEWQEMKMTYNFSQMHWRTVPFHLFALRSLPSHFDLILSHRFFLGNWKIKFK